MIISRAKSGKMFINLSSFEGNTMYGIKQGFYMTWISSSEPVCNR